MNTYKTIVNFLKKRFVWKVWTSDVVRKHVRQIWKKTNTLTKYFLKIFTTRNCLVFEKRFFYFSIFRILNTSLDDINKNTFKTVVKFINQRVCLDRLNFWCYEKNMFCKFYKKPTHGENIFSKFSRRRIFWFLKNAFFIFHYLEY